jgi:diguanylate cyclase (GGDEF)-like protein
MIILMADIDGGMPSEAPKATDLDAIAAANGLNESINWARTPAAARRLIGALAANLAEVTAQAASLVTALGAAETRADTAERRAATAEQTAQKAFVDEKTRIPNWNAFIRDMTVLVRNIGNRGRQRQSDVPGAHELLLFGDLDEFKNLNDTCGYDFGDFMLKLLASRWSEEQRPGDTTYRWGGDEFSKIARDVMPGQDAAVAKNFEDTVEDTKRIILRMIDDPAGFEAVLTMCNDETRGLSDSLIKIRLRGAIEKLGITVGYTIVDAAMADISQDEIIRRTHSKMQSLKKHRKKGQGNT